MEAQIEADDSSPGDMARIREDGSVLGRDYRGSKTVSFEVGVLTDHQSNPHLAGGDALDMFGSTWEDPQWRSDPTRYAVLRSHMVHGRVRRAYGRPRRYAESTDGLTKKGYSTLLADFLSADGTWYDDDPSTMSIGTLPAREGGLTTPLTTPLTTARNESRANSITVRGTKPTWITMRFEGPLTKPTVQIGNSIRVSVVGTGTGSGYIAAGETVLFDPRPWSRRIVREQDGANRAGHITWDTTPLRLCLLRPGTYPVTLTGTDYSGQGRVRLEWRNAWSRW